MVTSRIGRKPISIPAGVEVKLQDQALFVKGPKGQITTSIHPLVTLHLEDKNIIIKQNTKTGYCRPGAGVKLNKSIAGTTRAKLSNVIQGVATGYEHKLVLVGVGYRAQAKGKVLNLTLGYSHPLNFNVPEGITIETPSQTEIIIKGIDKHMVGHVAAMIRELRAPEPYKGKGVRHATEKVILKETKKK